MAYAGPSEAAMTRLSGAVGPPQLIIAVRTELTTSMVPARRASRIEDPRLSQDATLVFDTSAGKAIGSALNTLAHSRAKVIEPAQGDEETLLLVAVAQEHEAAIPHNVIIRRSPVLPVGIDKQRIECHSKRR